MATNRRTEPDHTVVNPEENQIAGPVVAPVATPPTPHASPPAENQIAGPVATPTPPTPIATSAPKRQGIAGNYFIVNTATGRISAVDQASSVSLTKADGVRLATEEEIAAHLGAKHQRVDDVYFIVNPAGAIHGVDRDHAATRLRTVGWRLATEEEITAYKGSREQRADRPIAKPWTPDPDAQLAAL